MHSEHRRMHSGNSWNRNADRSAHSEPRRMHSEHRSMHNEHQSMHSGNSWNRNENWSMRGGRRTCAARRFWVQ